MADAELETYKRVDGRFGWRLVHRNGDILGGDQNQGYEHKAEALAIGMHVVMGDYLRDDLPQPDDPPLDPPDVAG